LTGPAIGEPDPGRAGPPRTGLWDAAGGIFVLLVLGLAFRLIIAYLIPGSGFRNDLLSFQGWANDLADNGLYGFYTRPGFHDYTPGYLYVLWVIGTIGNLVGSIGDLIKIPPILSDLAIGYLVWSMIKELGGSGRAALIGAAIVLVNPITWFDSVVWGQVDSVGVVFLLLALRELWRDRPERSAILATVAALIKPQLGILIPIVAIVVIRRAFWPRGGFGAEDAPEPLPTTTGWEERTRGPLRVVTTGLAGLLTAVFLSMPFGLSLPGLVGQIFKTAGGYPYLSVNAFNPWALVAETDEAGNERSIALNRAWVCDSTIVASPRSEFRIGPWVIPELSSPGNDADTCPNGMMIGAFPASLVGAAMFLLAAALAVWLVARRPDRLTILVGLAVLALAFFVLPTRVHERYLFPFFALAAIPAAVSARWRIAYILSGAAMMANMYVVLTTYYRNNPNISDWLGVGDTLQSFWPVAIASVTPAVILAWAFFQLREGAVESLAEDVAVGGAEQAEEGGIRRLLGRLGEAPHEDTDGLDLPDAHPAGGPIPMGRHPAPQWSHASPVVGSGPVLIGGAMATSGGGGPGAALVSPAVTPARAPGDAALLPEWIDERDVGPMGPWAWFKARLSDPPVRADRSPALASERGGRLDRLDVWVLAVLAVSLLTVRMWRLEEPYQMHFDEVYHPRTATEFLQHWRYGLSHDIYEWTHPHFAKYAMALGLVAWGDDEVGATSELGVAVVDAEVEPRRDDGQDASTVAGGRVWVASGSEVRGYDLATRQLAATAAIPEAVALAFDPTAVQLLVGTRAGEIRAIDLSALELLERGPPIELESHAFIDLGGPLSSLLVNREGNRLAAVLSPEEGASGTSLETLVVIDAEAATELARNRLPGITQVSDTIDGRILVGTADGVAFVDEDTGNIATTLDVDGPVHGVVGINDINNDPIYATVMTPDGPEVAVVIAKTGEDPTLERSFTLPGDRAGRAFYDLASRMVHVEGSVPAAGDQAGATTVYVIEPHANAIYADAALPYTPSAIVLDDNQEYPASDRQQLLAFDEAGRVASVEIGRHAFAWRVPGVIAGVLMALLLYVLARLLFRRRTVAVILGAIVLVDGMLFAQSRIGMNDSYVGLGIIAAYAIFVALWLHPGDSRRHWLAFAVGAPLIGGLLGLALAAKWVAAYAIGGLGILILSRSALGRTILIAGMVLMTTVLGYIAISVAEGETGGNYLFLGIMVGLMVVAVIANVLHPIAWTWEEMRFAVGVPVVAGGVAILYGLARGDAAASLELGPVAFSPIELGFLAFLGAGAVYLGFIVLGRAGFGPLAAPPTPDDPAAVLEPPAAAPRGWLRLGAGFGLPALWLGFSLLVIPVGVYVASYLPWAAVESHRIVEGWPAGHTGQTLLDLTEAMYRYHNNLSEPHAASSPWWAWAFDLKPVWFYEEGFAGRTSASIYDSGNLVAWWLAIPALAFVAWQAFTRRSAALALIAIGFAVQWISWARIDRAAFQYHYYTSLPFLFMALAYFLAELWHGPSRRTWLLARVSAGVAVVGPFLMYLFHRPICAIARVTEVNPGSQACPTLIPEVTITPRAIAMAVVIGLGVLLLLRELLAATDPDEPADAREPRAWRAALARVGLGGRWGPTAAIAVATSAAFVAASRLLVDGEGFELTNIPVEPIAVVVTLALMPVAAYVATARDSRRFVLGALGAMGFWFVLWYPNLAALPLPQAIHNAYQGFLPTYLYPFQFWVRQGDRPEAPPLFDFWPAFMLLALSFTAIVIGYSAWSWRIALAERRRDRLAGGPDGADSAGVAVGVD
jgi:C-terminal four TMM region of protein-O-mannosyltransferase/Dolichyl-phosphate-mannose-protein mannosyltransferase